APPAPPPRELPPSCPTLPCAPTVSPAFAREPDPARIGPFFPMENYGLVDIDWKARRLTLTLKDSASATLTSQSFAW
ncbi:MAG: alkaline phosphatase family protein, partial [Erythrobacter cryptus]